MVAPTATLRIVGNKKEAAHCCAASVGILLEGDQFIVGMTKSAPSLMPEGQREVTVFVLV
jgi:hypothetical protein